MKNYLVAINIDNHSQNEIFSTPLVASHKQAVKWAKGLIKTIKKEMKLFAEIVAIQVHEEDK